MHLQTWFVLQGKSSRTEYIAIPWEKVNVCPCRSPTPRKSWTNHQRSAQPSVCTILRRPVKSKAVQYRQSLSTEMCHIKSLHHWAPFRQNTKTASPLTKGTLQKNNYSATHMVWHTASSQLSFCHLRPSGHATLWILTNTTTKRNFILKRLGPSIKAWFSNWRMSTQRYFLTACATQVHLDFMVANSCRCMFNNITSSPMRTCQRTVDAWLLYTLVAKYKPHDDKVQKWQLQLVLVMSW